MTSYFAVWLLGLLAFCNGALADGCGNVTISNAADAEATRKNCRIIQGDLIFGDLSETINLDGIEEVEGDILHYGCETAREGCTIPEPFTISSSTLRTVNQSLAFSSFPGLEKLVLPNLTTVGSSLVLKRLHNITHLDLTGLSYVGGVVMETRKLKTLLLDGLKGFTRQGGMTGFAQIWDAGAVESIDGFFKNPLNPISDPLTSLGTGISLSAYAIPNVRNVTIGWTNTTEINVAGVNLTVILGGPSTESMEIGKLDLREGIVGFKRNPKLKNLTATTFEFSNNNELKDLSVSFDRLANFTAINSDSLRSIEFPMAAEGWQNLGMHISDCSALNLSSEYATDSTGESRRTWYWPQGDMRRVVIVGNVATAFFDSFIETRKENQNTSSVPRVLERFTLHSTSGNVDCGVFDEMQRDLDIFSPHYICASDPKDNSAGLARVSIALRHPWQLGLLALGLLVPWL